MNPLLTESTLPYQLPPFASIRTEHYLPAFEAGIEEQRAEIEDIVAASASWENTVEALERSGRTLNRAAAVFFNLNGTDSNEDFDAIAAEILPKLSAHEDSIYQNSELYAKIKEVTPPADEESQRLHEHLLRAFRRRGADLNEEQKAKLSEYNQRLAVLGEEFRNNLQRDTKQLAVSLEADELDGLSEDRKAAAEADARSLDREGYVIPLELPTVQSEQSNLDNAEARAKLYEASLSRGTANADVALQLVRLRAERAELLGYASHAEYVLEEETAKTPSAVRQLLTDLAPAASANAAGEYKLISEDKDVEASDWSYYESKLRARDYALDEDELRQYFPLDRVLRDGVFYAAKLLYGIDVEETDLEGYAEGVTVWEVKENGEGIGLFLTDYFSRPSKRGGAWMSSFVDQSELLGTKPVIVNVMSITHTANPLLSLDEVTTLFHEFGHALHGLLSAVRYPTFSGTNVPRDYVEFPSQINENWAFEPKILRHYAKNSDGEVIPQRLVDAIEASKLFGQGFGTSEYLGAAIIDFAWHSLSSEEAREVSDVEDFEAAALEDAGLAVDKLAPRYKTRYFNHIFGGGYSAGYYSYLWAEALDADGFEWFKEQDDLREAGAKFRELILSKGGSRDFDASYETLRGRGRNLEPLLARRGLGGTKV